MHYLANHRRLRLAAAVLPLAMGLGLHAARAAEDSLPGDGIAQPLNVNIGIFYNLFTNAGKVGAVHGGSYDKDTHISTDITVARYVRTFAVDGFVSGVQVYEPYVAFIGAQGAGVANIAGPYVPALGGQLPAYGAGRANLSSDSGFGQPNFGVFSYLINRPDSGTYGVVSPWISPPISGFNKDKSLNPGQNVWTYEMELGFRTTLLGDPNGQNLAVELWSESYFFGANNNSALVEPQVSANHIPPIYGEYNLLSGGAIPDANPLQAASSTPARFNEQPSQEFRIYLPYEFLPATRAFISPGFYQSMGGKQTYTLRNGVKVDSGNRTNESQLRLVAASFVSQTTQIMLIGEYDLAAHGAPLNRNVEIRIATFF
jgi:hypothetical protein